VIVLDDSGAGEPLALLHGVGASRAIWRRATPLLAGRHRVLAPDLPGLGESPPARKGFELDDVADALAQGLAERTGGAPFDLVGNSLGGAVAIVLARRRPDLVRRLVLAAPAGLAPRRQALARVGGIVGARLVAGRRLAGKPLARSTAARRALLWGTVAEPQRLAVADARAMFAASAGSHRLGPAIAAAIAADLRGALREVRAPVGAIWGERDGIVPIAGLDTLLATLPGIPVERLAGVAHVPQIECPDAFAAALDRLLAQLAPVTPS
jgi:pimeloyl-ACP methyl ester carboxylesterase